MKKVITILLIVLISGCSPSPAAVEKALAQTLTAQPTATFTTAPTNTAVPTNTPQPTDTPELTGTPEPSSSPEPSSTPKPTNTVVVPTAKPAQPTSQPIAPLPAQPTQEEDLELDITIKVTNKCADTVTLTLVGPGTLKFVVPPGETRELQAAKGSYTTTDSFGYTWTQELHEAVWEITYCD